MPPFRFFFATALLAGSALTALPAAAGTLTWSPPQWEKREGDNRRIDVLNRQDCLNDATVTFSIQVRGVSTSAVLELWAGTNCDNLANRTTSGTKTCVQVTSGQSAVTTTTVKARLQDMVLPYTTSGVGNGTKESCDLETSPGLVPRSLFFVVYNSGTTMSELSPAAAVWAFKYDVKAPAPPTNVVAGGSEGALVTTFTPPSGESNLLRYHFYCSLATIPAATTGTGGTSASDTTASMAGSSDTTEAPSSDPYCGSDVLVPDQAPPEGAIDCGTVGAQGATGGETKEVLENSVNYAVAVATEDDANNVGVLSKLACATPQDITGFFEAYRAAGGQAGGGFCSFGPSTRGSLATLFAFGALGCALLWRRR
jgi:hypothetical protein